MSRPNIPRLIITPETEAKLASVAAAHSCSPQAMGHALLVCALEMPGAVLDGMDPAGFAVNFSPKHSRLAKRRAGLLPIQAAVLEWIASGEGGQRIASATEVFAEFDLNWVSTAQGVLNRLASLGLISKTVDGTSASAPSTLSITPDGVSRLAAWEAQK